MIQREPKVYLDWIPKQSIGQRIYALRQERGWTQQELCARSGVKRQYISMIESEYKGALNLTLDTLRDLARAFDLTLSKLFEGVE